MKFTICICLIAFSLYLMKVDGQVSSLENLRPSYRQLRYDLFSLIGRTDTKEGYGWNLRRKKVQAPFSPTKPFFCDPNGPGGRSANRPTSVHTVRPGDIDVVGALGDSLTAGNGALATNLLQVLNENKGVSWSIGGQDTWRKYLTLPNILKVFNPNLYGYSLSDAISLQKRTRFNAAELGAMSRDVPYEAKVLVKRMTTDTNVNITEDWKLITLMIGPNDYCYDLCYLANPENSINNHERDLIQTLRTLRDNLPRTIVNLVEAPNLSVITTLRGKPIECESGHLVECPCLFGSSFASQRNRLINIMDKWKQVVEKVSHLKEFNDKDDFAVVDQPFLRDVKRFPTLPNGNTDFRYMSLDCFHMSQKGYAIATNALWNNMLQPVGQKQTTWKREFTQFECPTVERPYIATNQNS